MSSDGCLRQRQPRAIAAAGDMCARGSLPLGSIAGGRRKSLLAEAGVATAERAATGLGPATSGVKALASGFGARKLGAAGPEAALRHLCPNLCLSEPRHVERLDVRTLLS